MTLPKFDLSKAIITGKVRNSYTGEIHRLVSITNDGGIRLKLRTKTKEGLTDLWFFNPVNDIVPYLNVDANIELFNVD